MALPDGLYDLLVTEDLLTGLDRSKAELAGFTSERLELLLDVLTRQLSAALLGLEAAETDAAPRQVEIINALLVSLRRRLQAIHGDRSDTVDLIADPPEVLRSVRGDRQFPGAPGLGLSVPWLFAAGCVAADHSTRWPWHNRHAPAHFDHHLCSRRSRSKVAQQRKTPRALGTRGVF